MSDYECGSSRKSKRDKIAKRRYRIYKKGGQHRTTDINYAQTKKEDAKRN